MIKRRWNFHLVAILFVLPALLLYTVLLINPVVQSVKMSFFSWNGIAQSPQIFVGLDNYKELIHSSEFWRALANVGKFLVVGFVLQMPVAFILSLIITSKIKGIKFFKTIFFIPVILPITAISIMWTFILWPTGGALNSVLQALGMHGLIKDWLGDPNIVAITIPLINLWIAAGLNMIIFSAGIVNIPEDLYEAAEIDGATGFKKVWNITLPLLKETIKIYAVLCVTGCLKVFDIVYVMTSGGPNGASDVPATLLYYSAFKYQKYGFASSIGTVILVLGLVVSILINKFVSNDEPNK
ncbi:MAG TPA: sugar ABC transporter permease [Ruminiclostridium sp.]|nr:sugar ABC transporter permease [Ruminiclostridium sp.]